VAKVLGVGDELCHCFAVFRSMTGQHMTECVWAIGGQAYSLEGCVDDPAHGFSGLPMGAGVLELFGQKNGGPNSSEALEAASDSFQVMVMANETATDAYRDLMEKQMQIFRDVTSEATALLQADPTKDPAVTYQQAVQRALAIMAELSTATNQANQQAYNAIKSQVDLALKEMRKKG